VLRIAAIGIVSVLLALQFKGGRQEYGIYLVLVAGVLIFSGVVEQMSEILRVIREYLADLSVPGSYLTVLYKMIGIAYLAEFASGVCKDAGYSFLAGQIELTGKVTILTISMPVVMAVFDTLRRVLESA